MITNNQELQQRYEELPDELAVLISSDDTRTKVRRIGEQYGLSEPELEILETEVGLTVLGDHHIDYFEPLIKGLLKNTPPQNVQMVIESIQKEIFVPVMASLKAIGNKYETEDEDTGIETPQIATLKPTVATGPTSPVTPTPSVPSAPRQITPTTTTPNTFRPSFSTTPGAPSSMRTFKPATPASTTPPSSTFRSATPVPPPAPYHDPMPIKVSPEPEKKPLIDTSSPNPTAGDEKYTSQDPYRESPGV